LAQYFASDISDFADCADFPYFSDFVHNPPYYGNAADFPCYCGNYNANDYNSKCGDQLPRTAHSACLPRVYTRKLP
jgi:hypothetical protein